MPGTPNLILLNEAGQSVKTCSRCRTNQPLDNFGKDAKQPTGLMHWCKECMRAYRRERYQRNPEAFKQYKKGYLARKAIGAPRLPPGRKPALSAEERANPDKVYRQRYRKKQVENGTAHHKRIRSHGITPEQFEKMDLEQNRCCAICVSPFVGPETRHIDHDHATGKVRGLLCRFCNQGLGHFRDIPEHLEKAALYLRKYR